MHSNWKWRRLCLYLLIGILALASASAQNGSITIGLPPTITGSNVPVKMQLFRLGSSDGNGGWILDERYSETVRQQILTIEKDLEIGEEKSLDVEETTDEIRAAIYTQGIESIASSQMQDGMVSFGGLSEGIYYAVMTEGPSEFLVQSPIIPIPYRYLGHVLFDVSARPKVSDVLPEVTSATVVKVWNDANNTDGVRPANLQVTLLENGINTGRTVILSAANGWSGTIIDLPYQDSNGNVISYTWQEANTAGYTLTNTNQAGTVTTLTNTHVPNLRDVRVQKIWDDNNDQLHMRPASLTVTLLANGQPIQNVVLNAANNWSATVERVPINDNNGPIVYDWREQEVLAYTLVNKVTNGNLTTFTNAIWRRPPPPDGEDPKVPGDPLFTIDDYDVPLGIGVILNHVGDCYE